MLWFSPKKVIDTFWKKYARWRAISPVSEWSIPLFRANFLDFTSKMNLPPGYFRGQDTCAASSL